jgi:predicted nucleotidyltransferase
MRAQHAPSIEERLPAMVAVIHQAIPGVEVRLFGSRARGNAGPDSDIDLLITAPDGWLQNHHRFEVLNALWDRLCPADVSLDLLPAMEIFLGVTTEQVRMVLEHAAKSSQGPGLPELRVSAEKAGQRPA